MLSVKDKGILAMIINHCKRISEKIESVQEDDFYDNKDLQEIVAFNLFQIGELANKFSDDFVEEYNEIPWKHIKGLRNRIVHGYDTIDFEIIWNTANDSVKELNNYCEKIIR